MPAGFEVELLPHNPRWADLAASESGKLTAAIGQNLLRVHHIGSTAIPDILAKPVLDIMAVVASLAAFDEHRSDVEALGYIWWGEYGLAGRRYCTSTDQLTGRRFVHLHCFVDGSPDIVRHLAFRDHLRGHSDIARAYEREKLRCQSLHPDDSRAYSECKGVWISRMEARALAEPAGTEIRDIR